MNCAYDQNNSTPEITALENTQSSLEMYEWYSPDKRKTKIPFINNPLVGLIQAVSDSNDYLGSKNLTMGNFYYQQGRYKRAIENYVLNTLPESIHKKYTLITDRTDSLLGIAKSFLKLGDISSSINYYYQAIQTIDSDKQMQEKASMDLQLFNDICSELTARYGSQLKQISNSLDIFEFVGYLLEDKSGWDLAITIIESIIEM